MCIRPGATEKLWKMLGKHRQLGYSWRLQVITACKHAECIDIQVTHSELQTLVHTG